MKSFTFNIKWAYWIERCFWLCSIMLWTLFFSKNIYGKYAIAEFNISGWFIVPFVLYFTMILAIPFVWVQKKLKPIKKLYITFWILLPPILLFLINLLADKDTSIFYFFLLAVRDDILYVFVFHITIIGAVYLNRKYLLSQFFTEKISWKYFGWIGLLSIVAAVANYVLFNFVIDKIIPSIYYISYFTISELILIMFIYLIFIALTHLVWQYTLMANRKSEIVQAELQALKAQINPHFLFNNLNSIYDMAMRNDPKTKDVVLQLSDFLRYILYDTTAAKITLEKEIETINTYIELQKVRINSNRLTIDFNVNGNCEGITIAPLLFLPMVENCFKHGIHASHSEIKIELSIAEKQLFFETQNRLSTHTTDSKEPGGLGLKNLEKRLSLLYPDCHEIHYFEKEGWFLATLKLELYH